MLSDERLGAALREAFDDLVGDLHPSLALLDRVDAIGTGARRPGGQARRGSRAQARRARVRGPRALRRWTLVIAPLVAVALIVTAIATLGSSGVTPSFAVTREPGGSIRVTVGQIANVGAENVRLRALGVRSIVAVAISARCHSHFSASYDVGALRPAPKITLTPRSEGSRSRVLIAVKQIGPNRVEMALGRFTGRPPSCVPLGKTGPGLSPRSTWSG